MYAVIVNGGKQYRVKKGDSIKLAKRDEEPGSSIELEDVLICSTGETVQIGAPYLAGCKVQADVVGHGRLDKIKILKFRRRKHHMKRMGHRQWYTEVKITDINVA